MNTSTVTLGLRLLSPNRKAPLVLCTNCKCHRHGTCGCTKGK